MHKAPESTPGSVDAGWNLHWLTREFAAFLILGLMNNLAWVTTNANAGDIYPGGVGIVYAVNSVPEIVIKITAPYWWHLTTYRAKIIVVGSCFLANLVLVGSNMQIPTAWKLVGVALSDLGSGLGESSVLALTQHFDNPSLMLTAWSSGTGFAGVVGYLLVMFVFSNTSSTVVIVISAVLVALYWFAYFWLLPKPKGFEPLCFERSKRELSSKTELDHDPSRDSRAAMGESFSAFAPRRSETSIETQVRSDKLEDAQNLGFCERLKLQLALIKYIVPIILVYFGEYAAQSGAWTAFALPPGELHVKDSLKRGYQYLNLFYQIGVLISRSSGKLFSLSLPWCWALSILQNVFLVLFVWDGATQVWVGYSLVTFSLAVGLVGGTLYIQIALLIDRQVAVGLRELALSTVSVGEPIGSLLADVVALFIQACLYQSLQISGATAACPNL